jgi:transcriptional regulator with AAA-type ATPase domain
MMGGRDAASSTTLGAGMDSCVRRRHQPVPGMVLLFADRRPQRRVFRLDRGPINLGRAELGTVAAADPLVSRKHVRFSHSGQVFDVEDLGSRNGTFVGSKLVSGRCSVPAGSVVRVGGVLFLTCSDVVPFEHYGVGVRDGLVAGPSLQMVLEAVSLSRSMGMSSTLLLTGESGTGKEIAARTFHAAAGKPHAPFSAVNCATIPRELAERLLFGARKGAYSGATDAPGYVQAANGGTLFLDEIGELSPDVQSKLLRVLEMREALRLGATVAEPVQLGVCAATLRDLRLEVSAGRFREDLYFRIGQPEIRLPALRERVEEVPWHIQQVLDTAMGDSVHSPSPSVGFVEACTLRHWPGNVRELRGEVRRAAATALMLDSNELSASDLSPTAGVALDASSAVPLPTPPEDEFAAALTSAEGNVACAARQLGVHRNKVRRWLERHRLDVARFKGPRKSPSA